MSRSTGLDNRRCAQAKQYLAKLTSTVGWRFQVCERFVVFRETDASPAVGVVGGWWFKNRSMSKDGKASLT
jgi:hypothetical protein